MILKMYKILTYINHNIPSDILSEIIRVKSNAWPYPFEKQLEWIQQNLLKEDIHVLLQNANENLAYLNLTLRRTNINDINVDVYGVGNVCSAKKGKGYGTELMKLINLYLIENQKIGLLFCKDNLVEYYSKFNWIMINKSQIIDSPILKHINTMIFNYHGTIDTFRFNGKLF